MGVTVESGKHIGRVADAPCQNESSASKPKPDAPSRVQTG